LQTSIPTLQLSCMWSVVLLQAGIAHKPGQTSRHETYLLRAHPRVPWRANMGRMADEMVTSAPCSTTYGAGAGPRVVGARTCAAMQPV
jgi:hypothetical protein